MIFPLPKRYQDLLEYIKPLKLKNNFHNYRIITTQDFNLKEKQRLVIKGILSIENYIVQEKTYIKKEYGFTCGKYYNSFFNKTRESKF